MWYSREIVMFYMIASIVSEPIERPIIGKCVVNTLLLILRVMLRNEMT